MLRAYRKNDYTGSIYGYVIETGISFIITVDYNKFKDIFLSAEQKKRKREIRKQNKEDKKAGDAADINQQTGLTSPAKEP